MVMKGWCHEHGTELHEIMLSCKDILGIMVQPDVEFTLARNGLCMCVVS